MAAEGVQKRSLTIAGHRTSISLEPVFWNALRKAAEEEARPLAALVTDIDEARGINLSSAIRVWLFERAIRSRVNAPELEEEDPC